MILYIHVRIQRGGGVQTPPPPPRFVRGGVLYGCLVERRGVQRWFYLIIIIFWLALHARRQHTYAVSKNLKNPNQFHDQRTWNGHPLSQDIVHIQLMIPGFHKSAFCLSLHDSVPFKTTPISTPPPKLSTN